MKVMRIKNSKLISETLIIAFALFLSLSLFAKAVFAQTVLPDGKVAGLDQGLTVMDDNGNSVGDDGEYYFVVDDMIQGQEYVKNIQIMNLREDKAYHIYLYVTPVSNIANNIDLEKDTQCTFWLNGTEIYTGKVNGDGNVNLREEPADLGLYRPGDSSVLKCLVVWNGEKINESYNNGHRVFDVSGEHIIEEPDADNSYYGEVKFQWKFYAVVDESYSSVKTGILSEKNLRGIIIILSGIILGTISILVVLINLKKQKQKTGN